jgi:hypothetical protein
MGERFHKVIKVFVATANLPEIEHADIFKLEDRTGSV